MFAEELPLGFHWGEPQLPIWGLLLEKQRVVLNHTTMTLMKQLLVCV